MEVLPSINGNRTKLFYKRLLPDGSYNKDVHNAQGTDVTRNFSNNGEILFEFNTGPSQKIPADRLFLEVFDTLSLGANAASGDPNDLNRSTAGGINVARSYNHIACLFSSVIFEIMDTPVDNVLNVAELDSYVKKKQYSQTWMNTYGAVQNLRPYSDRLADTYTSRKKSYVWHPDCIGVLNNQMIPQNSKCRLRLKPHPDYFTRAVESTTNYGSTTASVLPGNSATTYKYSVQDLYLYVPFLEAETIVANSSITMDVRPYKAVFQKFLQSGDEKDYNVPPTTYELGLAILSGHRDKSTKDSPSTFAENSNNTHRIKQYKINYVYDMPEYRADQTYSNDASTGNVGSEREFMISYLSQDKELDDGGSYSFSEWINNPVYIHQVVKRDDDKTTKATVRIDTDNGFSGTIASNTYYDDVFLFSQYSRWMRIDYDENGVQKYVDLEKI